MPASNNLLSRRAWLGNSTLALAGLTAAACSGESQAPGADTASDPDGSAIAPSVNDLSDAWAETPERLFRNFVRVRCDREGGVAPWWWSGVYVAVTPDRNPQVLFAAEGCETKRFVRLADDRYEVWSKVMTVFKNPESGEILNGKQYRNPFTGEMNAVEPNIIGSHVILQPDDEGRITETPAQGGDTVALDLSWVRSGDQLLMTGSRDYPEQRPIPLAEYGSTVVDIPALNDPGPSRLNAVFSSVYLAPWQGFLNMPDQPGHAVWHAVGRKTRGFHELTDAYMSEARRYIPDVLAWGDDA